MSIYKYDDLDQEEPKCISSQEILDTYWDQWYNQMIKKYGHGHKLITQQNCIDDWVITNWAWEIKNEN